MLCEKERGRKGVPCARRSIVLGGLNRRFSVGVRAALVVGETQPGETAGTRPENRGSPNHARPSR